MAPMLSKMFRESFPSRFVNYFLSLSPLKKYYVLVGAVLFIQFLSLRKRLLAGKEHKRARRGSAAPAINLNFFRQMKFLLSILVPKFWSPQVGILSMHTGSLIAKTFLSIHVAKLEGRIVKEIVKRDAKAFIRLLSQWIMVAIPACFLNSSIGFLERRLALSFRTRLVQHAYRKYFTNQVYYRVGNLDTRLQNPDHSLTEDFTNFTSSLARLYSRITKPLADAALISISLLQNANRVGSDLFLGPTIALSVIYVTGRILKKLSPNFGQLVAGQAELKARLRHNHARIVMNSEEIAFYGGDRIEQKGLEEAFRAETKQSLRIHFAKLWYIFIEQFFLKYVWAGSGMVLVAIPILTAKSFGDASGEANRTEYYMTTKNLLLAGGAAVEKLITSSKEVAELAGYASRVQRVLRVFDDVSQGNYVRESVVPGASDSLVLGQVTENSESRIELTDVRIVTPTGDVIVSKLNLSVRPGMRLLVTGPNGCGKSSLFRILSGLWPVYGGSLSRPPINTLFYIPQRPYMSLGNLREQVIYPDTREEMREKGFNDEDLAQILQNVRLSNLIGREGGWEAVKDWQDVLSGGEKQRLGLARLFYRKPSYALLDECTSAVSMDVEDSIYRLIIAKGINLLTISHRPSLFKHHTHILKFHGNGDWTFQLMDLSRELQHK